MPSNQILEFWSHELKGRRKVGNIPCIDGDSARYNLPPDVSIFPKTFRCTLRDIPSDCPTGYFDPLQQGPVSDFAFIPYVEIHGPYIEELAVEMGNPGDVYIASPPLTACIKIGHEKWYTLIPGVLAKHPYLKSIAAIFKEGTVVWESFHSPRCPLNAAAPKRIRPPPFPAGPPAAKRQRTGNSIRPSTPSRPVASPKQVAISVPPAINVNGPALGANGTSRQRLDDNGLALLENRIGALIASNENAQLTQEKLKTELQEMKGKDACRDGELAKLREDLEAATSRALTLSEEIKVTRLALVTAESKREEAENAEVSSQAVIDGLRQTLLREQMQLLKLKRDHEEACRVHGQRAAEMQDIVRNAKVELEQSVAAEETLHREKGQLHEQLSIANALKVALERDLAQEREMRFDLCDRISQLKAEVKKLPSESRSTDNVDEPVPVRPTNLGQQLESLPVEINNSLMPLIKAVATSFSGAHKKIEIERERAESAHNMYLSEKHAHAVAVRNVDERMCQVTQERDAALQKSESSQRSLLTLRKHLAHLSMADVTPLHVQE